MPRDTQPPPDPHSEIMAALGRLGEQVADLIQAVESLNARLLGPVDERFRLLSDRVSDLEDVAAQ